MKHLSSKSALITGGSSGIGLATAVKLSQAGMNICLLARDPAKLESACKHVASNRQSQKQRFDTIATDVANFEEVTESLRQYMQQLGPPDLLINSAGVCHPGHFESLDVSIFRQMMEINYFGTLHVTKAVIPEMIRRKSGHVVNVASIAGYHGIYGYSTYSPSKFAVRGLSDVLRYEMKHHGVQVSIVFPPDTQTPQLDYENRYKPPILKALDAYNVPRSADEVAEAIIRGIQKDRYLIVPGFDNALLFTLNSLPWHLPYFLMDWMLADSARKAAKNGHRK